MSPKSRRRFAILTYLDTGKKHRIGYYEGSWVDIRIPKHIYRENAVILMQVGDLKRFYRLPLEGSDIPSELNAIDVIMDLQSK